MSDDDARRAEVGRQLRRCRKRLGLTQEALAPLIGVTSRTVSAIERGENCIQAGHQPSWETTLRLVAGTLNRAYETGSPIEALPEPAADETTTAANDDFIALLSARVADMEQKVEQATSDDRIDILTARVALIEEHLDEERRTREALQRTVTELTKLLSADQADRKGERLPRTT